MMDGLAPRTDRSGPQQMDSETVSGLVTAIVSTYNAALEYYTRWQRKRWQENSYVTREKGRLSSGGCCGLSTSLGYSAPRIREAYNAGADLLGDCFSTGDGA